eukprot:COSAG03_NODE_382_length_8333_cov_5.320986_2_plen_137_part_00
MGACYYQAYYGGKGILWQYLINKYIVFTYHIPVSSLLLARPHAPRARAHGPIPGRCILSFFFHSQGGLDRARFPDVARLGLAVLAGCGCLLAAAVLRCFASRPLMQTRRSDLCSRHQHGSSGLLRASCFVSCSPAR